jgi:hypothetical protein
VGLTAAGARCVAAHVSGRLWTCLLRLIIHVLTFRPRVNNIPPTGPCPERDQPVPYSFVVLALPDGPCPSGFPVKTRHAFLFSAMRATCSTHLILVDLMALAVTGDVRRYGAVGYGHVALVLADVFR